MWIMVSGPYRSGSADPAVWAANRRAMDEAALAVFRAGHVPVIGVDVALPLIEIAGEAAYDGIMMPLSLALADRCDACLRIGGPSVGADQEAERFRALGRPVYRDLAEIPATGSVE